MTKAGADAAPPRSTGLRSILGGAVWSLCEAARSNPRWLALSLLASLLLALVPAGQVRAVAWLVGTADDGVRAAALPLLVLTALVGAGLVVGSAENLVGQRASVRLMHGMNDRLARTAAAMDARQITDPRTHALLEGSRESTFLLSRGPGGVINAVCSLVAAVALGAAIWPFSPLAAGLVVLALVPNLVNFAWAAGMQDARFEEGATHGARFRYLLDQLVGARTATELATLGTATKVADDAGAAHARFSRINDQIYAALLRGDIIGGAVTAVLLGGALLAVLAEGGGAAGLSAGVLGVIAGLQSTRSAGYALGDVISLAPRIARFRELEEIPTGAPQQDVVAEVRRLEATSLSVTYPGQERPALQDATLHATAGETIALVGINGAGKTTLVSALLGVIDLDHGTVEIDGSDASALTAAQRFSRFSLVTQEFGRYEMTVRDAVALGSTRTDIADEEIWAALDAARAGELVRRLPGGLDTMLGPQFDGVGLSGGQWQRIALARIHLRGAGIRVLDEPTSAIDAEAEQEVFAQLRETAAGHITVVVSHRAWTLRGMDRIHLLDEGRIVESGDFEELAAPGTRFSEIFAQQLS
ncbi:ATP-binding cassette domain-containing protein [Brachybacterium sacelli]|uniref:ATP-binding cassette subfamily B protein n=1 Tax=Brachybacterium sacelli TaxID=173364 RepID=A0ABS4X1D5_9MICO|nr:ABC transporter ATP-binding protein [Brachybacterium sacelli]MBP2382272.1 ATP-binding cassette subfamily B protein [Brachybacterium sacelli]